MKYDRITPYKLGIDIVKKLRLSNFEAYFAGGCVRDMLLGRTPKDYDVATNAMPNDVIKIFRRTITVGAKFGVVIVMQNDAAVEVATFRSDCKYIDGRHPESVHFSNITEDAIRRDFTINGMYYDPFSKKVVDVVGGQKDLQKKIIRAIGQPKERFNEDYLRMLRAIRFGCQLDFEIEKETFKAVCDNCKKINKISFERISVELEAILTNPNRLAGCLLLENSGLLVSIFDSNCHIAFKRAFEVIKYLPKHISFALGLASLFSAVAIKLALNYCNLLKLSNKQIKHIKFLLEHKDNLSDGDISIAHLKLLCCEPYFQDLLDLHKAIIKSENLSMSGLRKNQQKIKAFQGKELKPKPLLDGYELMALGAKEGELVGQLSRQMYIAQLNEELTTKTQARQWVKNWLIHKATDASSMVKIIK